MNCVNNIEVQEIFWSIVNLFLHGSLATTHFIKLQPWTRFYKLTTIVGG